ncbi:hypothetical protein ACLBPS_29790, partial [Klebsiella pneumoniae]|uniref:hypothetical protein n=1 Tax=Klebsiella pneumoniae TaxID=573 RepID=UPI003969C5FB
IQTLKISHRKAQEEDDKAISEMYEAELDRDLSEQYGESDDTSDESSYSWNDSTPLNDADLEEIERYAELECAM